MQIQFCGGAQTVTGSQHLLSVNGKKILLECGLFQGRRKDTYEKNLNFCFDLGRSGWTPAGQGVLVLPASSGLLKEKSLQDLMDRIECPVLVVR